METWEEGRENWKCPRVGKRAIEKSWGLRFSSWNFLWSWGFFLSWLSLSWTSSFPSNLVLKYLSLLGLLSYIDRFESWVFMCAWALPSFGPQVFKIRFFNPILGLWPSVSLRLESSIQLQSRPLDLLLVLDHLTGGPGIRNSSAMLILIADTLHLLEAVRRCLYKHTKEHTHTKMHKKICKENCMKSKRGRHRLKKYSKENRKAKWEKNQENRDECWNWKPQRTKRHWGTQSKGKKRENGQRKAQRICRKEKYAR